MRAISHFTPSLSKWAIKTILPKSSHLKGIQEEMHRINCISIDCSPFNLVIADGIAQIRHNSSVVIRITVLLLFVLIICLVNIACLNNGNLSNSVIITYQLRKIGHLLFPVQLLNGVVGWDVMRSNCVSLNLSTIRLPQYPFLQLHWNKCQMMTHSAYLGS